MTRPHPLAPLAARLGARVDLSQDDRAALLALPHQLRDYPVGAHIVQEGDQPSTCQILLSGFAHRHRFSAEGLRHIVGLHGQGDILNLPALPPAPAEDFVQALSAVRVAMVPIDHLLDLSRSHARVGDALWAEVEAEMVVVRAWIANMGRRDARGRIAHLFCELVMRDDPARAVDGCLITLPLTQTELADATGMTSVHVNRTLRSLEADGFIRRQRRQIMVPSWSSLAALADFRPTPWVKRGPA
jgi:CRP-like cAMP-binding protein